MKKHVLSWTSKFIIAMMLLIFITVPNVEASSVTTDTVIDTRTLAMINKPGVVLIQTIWTADITLYEFAFSDTFEEDLTYSITALVEEGTIPNTEEAMYAAMVQWIIENMMYYTVTTGNTYTETSSTGSVGTGFIVTEDGYLVTNAHVVETNEEELYLNFAMTSLENYAIEGTNSFVTELRSYGYEMSQEEIDGMMNAFFNVLSYHLEINNLQTSYQCFMGNITPGSDVSAKGVGLDLRKAGESIPGKDIAVLKMDKTNLPTVVLGDDTKLRTGDKVYAMGYPALATVNDALNISQAIQEPTLTSGIISARKEMAGGWSVFQTDAAIHGGNSGGPLFNEAGEVIGINTFILRDPEGGSQIAGMNFAIPVSIAKQFLNEMNVTPVEGHFTTQYKKALTHYQNQEYNEALEILRGLNETNPGYPVVAELLAECRTLADQQPKVETTAPAANIEENVAQEHVKEGKGFGNIILFAVIGVVVVGLIVVIILLATRKKKPDNRVGTYSAVVHPTPVPAPTQIPAPSVETDTKRCTKCGKILPKDAKFCSGCGNSFTQPAVLDKCPKCNQPIQPGDGFCGNCGAKILGESTDVN